MKPIDSREEEKQRLAKLYDYPWWNASLRHYQQFGADWLHQPPDGFRGRLLADPLGYGKALSLSTPIPTPLGWKTVGSLGEGDTVLSEDGTPTSIVKVFEVPNPASSFDVIFSDGEVIRCCGDHRWKVWTPEARAALRHENPGARSGSRYGSKTIRTVPLIMSTTEMVQERGRLSVRANEPLHLPSRRLPLDPYLLGLWLGNGHAKEGKITSHARDLPALELKIGTYQLTASKGLARTVRVHGLLDGIHAAKVYDHKHIPDEYLWASMEQRIELVRGLMDSDGTVSMNGHCCFDNTNEEIVTGFETLLASLGIKYTRAVKYPQVTGRPEAVCKPCLRVMFTTDMRVATVPFKASRLPREVRATQQWRYIDRIEPAPIEPMRCFTVDHPSAMYLCGKSMVPTHNTRTALAAARIRAEKGLLDAPVMAFTSAISRVDWKREAGILWPEARVFLPGSKTGSQPRKGETPEDFEARLEGSWRKAISEHTPDRPVILVQNWDSLAGMEKVLVELESQNALLDHVLIDECFVPGTEILTPSGVRRIEDLKEGDLVWGFSEEGMVPCRVNATAQRDVDTLIDVVVNGVHVKSSKEHPYLTTSGWVPASQLTPGMEVVCLVQQGSMAPEEESVLRQVVLSQVEDDSAKGQSGRLQRADPHEDLVYLEAAHGRGTGAVPGHLRDDLQTDVEEEPNALGGDSREGVRADAGTSTEGPRREREADAGTTAPLGQRSRVGDGGEGQDQQGTGTTTRGSHRHCQPPNVGGGRGRWKVPQNPQATGPGPEEADLPGGFGLARVESVQRVGFGGHSSGGRVHNVEVGGTHTYILKNGAVVHNCHNMKRASSKLSMAVRLFVSRARVTSLITATAIDNRPHDLYNLLDLCGMGKFGSFSKFAQRYFLMHSTVGMWGSEVGELLDRDGLNADMKPIYLRRSVADAFGQLPARIRIMKRVEVPGVIRVSPAKIHKAKEGSKLDLMLRECVKFKFDTAIELVRNIDKPVVLYTYQRDHAEQLASALKKAKIPSALAHGDVPVKKRAEVIENWKRGEGLALVCTMDAVRESATLTRAADMIFVDLTWRWARQLQNEGRIDPARQPENERRPARYWYIVTENGPDEIVANALVKKAREASGVGGETSDSDEFAEFLSPLAREEEVMTRMSEREVLEDLTMRMNEYTKRMSDLGMVSFDTEYSGGSF